MPIFVLVRVGVFMRSYGYLNLEIISEVQKICGYMVQKSINDKYQKNHSPGCIKKLLMVMEIELSKKV